MSDNLKATSEQKARSRAILDLFVSFGWIILFFALQFVTGIVAIFAAIALHPSETPWMQRMGDMQLLAVPTIWSLVAANLLTIFFLHFYLRRHDRYANLGLRRWSEISAPRTIALGLAVSAIGIGFNFLYTEYVIPGVKIQEMVRALIAAIPDGLPYQILVLFAAAIIPAIVEELIFRGLLQNSIKTLTAQTRFRKASAAIAILLSAMIFAALHMDYYAAPALFVLGASFGFLYEKTGSLRVNILMHMLNNSAALLLGGS